MDPKRLLTKEGEEHFVNPHLSITTDASSTAEQPQRHFGDNTVFWFYKGEPLITLGPHFGIFMMCFLAFELLGFVVYYFCASHQSLVFRIVYKALIVLEAITYLWTALKNPGIITAKDFDDPSIMENSKFKRFCKKCSILRVKNVFHCPDCDVCIREYDHHCPWTGKCIGAGNLYAFYAFLIVTLVYFIASVGLIILRIVQG